VSAGGAAVPGAFTLSSGGAVVSFKPAAELPFDTVVAVELTGDIRDLAGNRLVNADGSAIGTPMTSTYVTGAFAIVSPSGSSVLEERPVTLEARAAASLNVSSVVFTVNGTALAAVTAAPFARELVTPPAASAQTLTVIASARNASGAEIARAERVYQVLAALRVTPSVLGLRRGGSRTLHLSVTQPLDEDLPISLTTSNASVAVDGSAVLRAGQTAIDLPVVACVACPSDPAVRAGAAVGNAAIVAASARGIAIAIASVSDPLVGTSLTAQAAPAGLAIALPPSAGQLVIAAGRQSSSVVTLLPVPATSDVAVSITSSNPAIATATATAIHAGTQVTTLSLVSGVEGTAVLTVRAGDVVRSITVIVGTPAANQTPIALAPAVGASVPSPPFAGQAFAPMGRAVTLGLVMLPAPAASPRSVTVTSSDPAVVQVAAPSVTIAAGSRIASIEIVTGSGGRATLTMMMDGERRDFTVVVGAAPSPGGVPVAAAPSVGVSVVPSPGVGRVVAPAGSASTATLGVQLLRTPRAANVAVTVTSSNPQVVTLSGGATMSLAIAAGSVVLPTTIGTSGSEGAALLTFEFEGQRMDLVVVVGSPPASQLPAVVAPIVGVLVP
jgi:hypothetical protein